MKESTYQNKNNRKRCHGPVGLQSAAHPRPEGLAVLHHGEITGGEKTSFPWTHVGARQSWSNYAMGVRAGSWGNPG